MARTGDSHLLPSVRRWLQRYEISEETTYRIYNSSNSRVSVYHTGREYLTFHRTRGTPVICYRITDLLPVKLRKRVRSVIALHQQLLIDGVILAQNVQA